MSDTVNIGAIPQEAEVVQDTPLVSTAFWVMYDDENLDAWAWLIEQFQENEEKVKEAVPSIIEEARRRELDPAAFLQEYEDAARAADNGGGIPAVVDNETSEPEDADGASASLDDDGEDQVGVDTTEGSEGV